MRPLTVLTWKWGEFGAPFVNRLRDGLERHLHLPHRLYCLTDDPTGIDARVWVLPAPDEFRDTPRCCRRLWQYSRNRRGLFGDRILCLDLDTVFAADITPLIDRPEPLVLLRMEYAEVYSPAMLLMDTGILHEFYEVFAADPEGFRAATGQRQASDLAMLNYFLGDRVVPSWGRTDGVVAYFGAGYEKFVHLGVGPKTETLPPDTRVVVLGSADLPGLLRTRPAWWRTHWEAA